MSPVAGCGWHAGLKRASRLNRGALRCGNCQKRFIGPKKPPRHAKGAKAKPRRRKTR